jgi:hypothetical protein
MHANRPFVQCVRDFLAAKVHQHSRARQAGRWLARSQKTSGIEATRRLIQYWISQLYKV